MSCIYIILVHLLQENMAIRILYHQWHFSQFLNVINITARHEKGILHVWISTWPAIPECDLDFLLLSMSTMFFIQGGNTGTYSRWVLLPQTVHKIPFPNMLACTPINYHQYKNSKHRKVGIKFEYHFCETKLVLETEILIPNPNKHLYYLFSCINELWRGLMLHASDWSITRHLNLTTVKAWVNFFHEKFISY